MDYDDLIQGFSSFGLNSTNAGLSDLPPSASTALSNGVTSYYQSRRPSTSVIEARQATIERVSRAIRNRSSRAFSVMCVGSTIVGHDSATSDLDLIILDSARPTGLSSSESIYGLPDPYNMVWVAGILREAGFTNVEAVTSAAVPIVKFHDPRSGLDSDVNCNSRLGISVTTLFERYCSLYTGLRAMIFVIKKWAGLYDLNNPSISSAGRYNVSFSSYCLVLMIISYLQIKGVLPNLQSSDRLASVPSSVFNIRDKFKGWIRCDTRIGSARGFRGEELSVGDAVYGWFRYFAHEHRYSTQYLSIRHGGLLPSGHFQRSDLKSSELTVQDPFIVSKNVSGSCRSHVIQKFREECGRAATALKDGTSIEKLLERRTSSQYGSASTSRYIPSSSYTSAPRYTSTSSPYRSRYIPSTSSGMFRF